MMRYPLPYPYAFGMLRAFGAPSVGRLRCKQPNLKAAENPRPYAFLNPATSLAIIGTDGTRLNWSHLPITRGRRKGGIKTRLYISDKHGKVLLSSKAICSPEDAPGFCPLVGLVRYALPRLCKKIAMRDAVNRVWQTFANFFHQKQNEHKEAVADQLRRVRPGAIIGYGQLGFERPVRFGFPYPRTDNTLMRPSYTPAIFRELVDLLTHLPQQCETTSYETLNDLTSQLHLALNAVEHTRQKKNASQQAE